MVTTSQSTAGQGAAGERRHKRVLRDSLRGITKPAIKRLARRGGVRRLSTAVYDEIRSVIHQFLLKIVYETTLFTDYAKREVVTAADVLQALELNGRKMYGF